ncbi:MAG: fructose PTS transporter subunit IIA, partial [Vibrionaceae bacterium]
MQLINEKLVCLDLKACDKKEVLQELVDILYQNGRLHDPEQFLADVYQREALGNTGFEEGIALPHAKSAAVKEPAVVVGISRQGIDYGAEDGKPSQLFFMIASPENGGDHHIEVLAKLSGKLLEEGFVERLMAARDPKQAVALLLEQKEETAPAATQTHQGFLIGVTGCPAGIAHTYLAAEALEKSAAEMGFSIKVETNGSIGVKNSPSEQEIADAAAIIVASDKQVDLSRFAGKKVIITNVKEPIRDAKGLINKALQAPLYQAQAKTAKLEKAGSGRTDFYRYLMNGVSHMIPFVVSGGLLIALALAIGGEPSETGMVIPEGSLWNNVLAVGAVAFTLMLPVLSGYIAYAIADRPALAPGLIGGWIANNGSFYGAEAGTGFIGAIIAGLAVGYFVKWVTGLRYHKYIQPLVPIM